MPSVNLKTININNIIENNIYKTPKFTNIKIHNIKVKNSTINNLYLFFSGFCLIIKVEHINISMDTPSPDMLKLTLVVYKYGVSIR